MRKRELDRLLGEWQIRLGLADWDLDVEFIDPSRLPAGDMGELEYVSELREGTIRVSRAEKDPESVLVHELLHCWTRQIREARKEDLPEEQGLNSIGNALIDLKRNGGT